MGNCSSIHYKDNDFLFCPYCGCRLLKRGKPLYEKVSDIISFVGYCEANSNRYEVYDDDYGQCFFIKYLDKNNEMQEVGCGTYCNYDYLLEEIIRRER